MATKKEMQLWVEEALKAVGGSGQIAKVAEQIWKRHEHELRGSGDLLYTWQYDMRWAATVLRNAGVIKATDNSPNGVWELTSP